jgi:hypothetical protein
MPGNIELLVEVVKMFLRAENRYKDGHSDERWSDAEMAANKTKARDMALSTLKAMGVETKGL